MTDNSTPGFYVVFLGQIEGCKMDGVDNLYCKYSFNYGLDWSTSHGLEHGIRWVVGPDRAAPRQRAGTLGRKGIFPLCASSRQTPLSPSQIAQKGDGENQSVFAWNYPIEVTFKSTNVHGWPQIVLSVYGINALGKDVIRCAFLPIAPQAPPSAPCPTQRSRPCSLGWAGAGRTARNALASATQQTSSTASPTQRKPFQTHNNC